MLRDLSCRADVLLQVGVPMGTRLLHGMAAAQYGDWDGGKQPLERVMARRGGGCAQGYKRYLPGTQCTMGVKSSVDPTILMLHCNIMSTRPFPVPMVPVALSIRIGGARSSVTRRVTLTRYHSAPGQLTARCSYIWELVCVINGRESLPRAIFFGARLCPVFQRACREADLQYIRF
jgi:hypothetical protein